MSVVVCPATPDELPSLSELCLRSKAVWGYDQAFLQACRRELTIVADELRSTLIAVADDQDGVAGVVQIKVVQTDANLLKLFVEPSKLRMGIGSMLFDWAIEQATNMGATRLFIEADPDAAQFYRGVGAFDVGFAPSESIPGRLLPKLAFNLTGDRV